MSSVLPRDLVPSEELSGLARTDLTSPTLVPDSGTRGEAASIRLQEAAMADARTAAPAETPAAKLAKIGKVRRASSGLVFMLILEFILGVVYNLYGAMPTSAKSIGLFSNGWLIVHEILAILLLLAAIQLVVMAMGSGSGLAKGTSWVGLIGIIAAIGAGMSFTRNGASGASLGMAIAFAVSLACYVVNLTRLRPGEL
jgi:hypothetical protein